MMLIPKINLNNNKLSKKRTYLQKLQKPAIITLKSNLVFIYADCTMLIPYNLQLISGIWSSAGISKSSV